MSTDRLFRELGIPIIKGIPKGLHPYKRVEFFKKGNNYAAKERMDPEAHERRMAGLRKTWERHRRTREGEKMGITRRKRVRIKLKLRKTIAKEAREIQKIAQEHADRAMERLAEIVNSPSSQDSVAIAAASVILDRAYGKANQTNINANVSADGKPSEITSKDLDTRIRAALKRVESIAGGAPKAPKSEERPADVREPDTDPDGATKH